MSAAEEPNDDDDDEVDDDFLPTDEEVEAEKSLLPEMMQHAEDWDGFRTLAIVAMRPFDPARGDSSAYRDERAVEYFEAAVAVARAMKRHNPESTSAIPSVMVEVVPRMIKLYGCQLKLGSDVSECHVPGSKHVGVPRSGYTKGPRAVPCAC